MAEIEKTAVLTIDTGASQTSIKDLVAQMKELKNQMANVEEGSQEFYELAEAAAEVKHQVEEINQTVKYSSKDFGDMVGNTARGMAGLVGSINAVKGTMNLLGVESENVGVAIQKMQSAMAVVQGLQAVDQGIKAFKGLGVAIKAASASLNGFKAALVATGIGAAIVAIGMLIAYWDDLKEAIWGGADAAKEAAEEIAASAAKSVDALRDISAELSNLTDQGVENFKAVAIQDLNDITNAERQMDKNFTESAAYLMDLYRLQQQALKQGNIENAKYWKETLNTALEGHDKVKDALNNYIKAVEEGSKREKKANEEVQRSQEAAAKAREDAAKKRKAEADAEAKRAAKELETFKAKYQELSIDISRYNLSGELLDIEKLKDERDKAIEVIEEAKTRKVTSAQEANEQIAAINAHYDELIVEKNKELNQRLTEEAEEARQASVEKAMMAVLQTYDQLSLEISQKQQELSSQLAGGEISDEQYDEGVESLEIERIKAEIEMYQQQLETEQLTADERLQIETNLVNAKIALDEKSAKHAKWAAEQTMLHWRNAMNNAATFAGSITSALDSVASALEEGSEEQKAIQITSATINMLSGIVAAISGTFTTHTGIWDIAIAAAQAAAIATSGAINIAKIAQTNKDNASSMANGASVSSSAISSTLVAPVQYTQAVEGASLEQNIQDSRVYVVESDITDTQDKVRVSENEATF